MTTPTPAPPAPAPATDEEIAEWQDSIVGQRPDDGELAGVRWMEEDEWAYRLVLRIDHDRRLIAEQAARIESLMDPCPDCEHPLTLDDDETPICVVCLKDAEIAKLRDLMFRYVRAEDALTHYLDETPDHQLVSGVEADLAEEETEALDAIRAFARAALKEK